MHHKELKCGMLFLSAVCDSHSAILRIYGLTLKVQQPLMSLKVEQSKVATRVFFPVL